MGAAVRRLIVVLFTFGCTPYAAAPPRSAVVPPGTPAQAYEALHSISGPTRFSQVSPRIYRGGQPNAAQLLLLHQLGVRTVVSLRDEADGDRAAEERVAERLGMRFLSFPFSGLVAPDPVLLHQIVDALHDQKNGTVYVHCHAGRDRTSLVVALYRVWVEGWAPNFAWQREARDFGHSGNFFLRALDRTFERLATQRSTG